jgi:Holliday junction resolvasome RuvABC endonuclease subunit
VILGIDAAKNRTGWALLTDEPQQLALEVLA